MQRRVKVFIHIVDNRLTRIINVIHASGLAIIVLELELELTVEKHMHIINRSIHVYTRENHATELYTEVYTGESS